MRFPFFVKLPPPWTHLADLTRQEILQDESVRALMTKSAGARFEDLSSEERGAWLYVK
jgi:hypothetical protein